MVIAAFSKDGLLMVEILL